MDKQTLDILIDALSEQEWNELKRRAEAKQAFKTVDTFRARQESAIQFGDWILKKNVIPGYDEERSACWVVPDGTGTCYTTLELYRIYVNGEWEDNDISIWDVTLMDGLEEEEDI